jgi:hypothetical protein
VKQCFSPFDSTTKCITNKAIHRSMCLYKTLSLFLTNVFRFFLYLIYLYIQSLRCLIEIIFHWSITSITWHLHHLKLTTETKRQCERNTDHFVTNLALICSGGNVLHIIDVFWGRETPALTNPTGNNAERYGRVIKYSLGVTIMQTLR